MEELKHRVIVLGFLEVSRVEHYPEINFKPCWNIEPIPSNNCFNTGIESPATKLRTDLKYNHDQDQHIFAQVGLDLSSNIEPFSW